MKVREIVKKLRKAGWRIVRHKGSHRQLQHPKTAASILKQAGLEEE